MRPARSQKVRADMPTEVIMPKVDMDMESGTIATWHAGEGDWVEAGKPLFDIETDKAAMEVEAPASGRLGNVIARPGEVIAIGKPLAWIYADDEATNGTPAPTVNTGLRASPLARRLARESGIDLAAIAGSGPRGRVMRKDVDAHRNVETPSGIADNDLSPEPSFKTVPVDRMRATIARRLTESQSTIPHFYLDIECRLNALLTMRRELNDAQESRGRSKVSVNDLIIKASALALEAVPEANASWQSDFIHQHTSTDISMAVALEGGLVTPVIKGAAGLPIDELSARAKALVEKARQGKLPKDAISGGRLTVSNLGMFGVRSFAAIINPPESMILAVGKAERRFVPDENDAPVAVTLLPVTLSCDHRVIDGTLGARWLGSFRDFVEHPMRLLL
ncbi:MAG: dihydrolipoamide acetyltransferase family protein [Geminicoccaceae bacterium]